MATLNHKKQTESGTSFSAGDGLTLNTSTNPNTLNVDTTQSISTINNASSIVNTAGNDITITCNSGGAFSQNFNYKFESSNGDLDIPGDYLKNGTNILASKQDTLTFNSPSSNNTNPSTSAQIKAYAQKAFFASNPEADLGTEFFLDINTGLIGILTSNNLSSSGTDIATNSGVNAGLALKQNSLTFDAPSSNNSNPSTSAQIKSALDLKQDVLTAGDGITIDSSNVITSSSSSSLLLAHTTQSLASPNDNMNKIKNLVVSPFHQDGTTTSNQGTTYFPNLYSIAHSQTINGVKNCGFIDTDVFTMVAPPYNTATTNNDITGANARYGIKILQTGLFKYKYSGNVENETHNDRMSVRGSIVILYTNTSGTETNNVMNQSIATEYMRDNDQGQFCNINNFGYFEITNDMISHSNGCFLKLQINVIRGSGETFNEGCNSIKYSLGCLQVEKIADLATASGGGSGGSGGSGSSITIAGNRVCVSDGSGALTASDVTTTELNFLDGLTENVQNALNNSSSSTITANRVCVSDGSGALTASDVTTTELNYLDNVNSNIQNQLNSKLGNSSRTFNSDRTNGEVLVRCNTLSDSDTGGVEGQARSQFTVNMRARRNAGGFTVTENKMRIECSFASDNNGRRDNMNFRGGINSNTTNLLSDDRIKFDEQEITNALNVIDQLKVYKYNKYNCPINADLSRPTDETPEIEIGLIAQDLELIPELSHTVGTSLMFDDETIAKKNVKYNDVFCLALKAIKELKIEVDNLKQRITEMEE
jgi:hypothetical protein